MGGHYKCGVFFQDITSRVPLAWLGALPDSLGKNEQAQSEADLEYKGCGDKYANARCYELFDNITKLDLESCDKWWLHRPSKTHGDYLCGQARRWLRKDPSFKKSGRDNIEVVFMYSECGNDWTEIKS